jgi:hypothetical protein
MPRFAEQKPEVGQDVVVTRASRADRATFVIMRSGEEAWQFREVLAEAYRPGYMPEPVYDGSLSLPDDWWEPFESPEETRAINEALVDWNRPLTLREIPAQNLTVHQAAALRVLQGFASRPESHRLDPSIAAATAFEWADAYCNELERRS